MQKNPLSRTLVFIVLGLVLGGIMGEFIGLLLGHLGELANEGFDNKVRALFIHDFSPSFGFDTPEGWVLDLYMIKIKMGFAVKLNVISLVGLGVAMYIERWSRSH